MGGEACFKCGMALWNCQCRKKIEEAETKTHLESYISLVTRAPESTTLMELVGLPDDEPEEEVEDEVWYTRLDTFSWGLLTGLTIAVIILILLNYGVI